LICNKNGNSICNKSLILIDKNFERTNTTKVSHSSRTIYFINNTRNSYFQFGIQDKDYVLGKDNRKP